MSPTLTRCHPFSSVVAVLILLTLALFTQGCATQTAESDGGASQRQIVCTTGMVADIVRNVVGDQYEVISLMGEGVDPHLYKPTTSDTAKLQQADVIFYSGLMLEGPMEKPLETLARSKPVFAVTAGIPEDQLRFAPEFDGHPDPHVWMDVSVWSLAVWEVASRMGEIDSQNAVDYEARATQYMSKLAELHKRAKAAIASIPESQRYLVTAHDAFAYFSRAYEIPVESAQGITTESEPGVNDIVQLSSLLVERKIPAIFVESSVNEDNLKAVLESAAQDGWDVAIGGTLYSDAMGAAGTPAGTYIGMIEHNVRTIVEALGGDVPDRQSESNADSEDSSE